jgi:hypothetical protein
VSKQARNIHGAGEPGMRPMKEEDEVRDVMANSKRLLTLRP